MSAAVLHTGLDRESQVEEEVLHQTMFETLTGGLTPSNRSVHAQCMAVKTVTIDMEAYDLLSRHKREGQSFSQVIKEHFSGPKKGRDLMALLPEVSLSEEALDAIEEQVKKRKAHTAKAPEL